MTDIPEAVDSHGGAPRPAAFFRPTSEQEHHGVGASVVPSEDDPRAGFKPCISVEGDRISSRTGRSLAVKVFNGALLGWPGRSGLLAAVVAVGLVGYLAGCTGEKERQGVPESPPFTTPEATARELEWLRSIGYLSWTDQDADASRWGVTRRDPEALSFGFNLFTNDVDTVHLMGMSGKILHSWHIPGGRHCEYAEILPGGELIVVCVGQWLVRLDWDSRILWKLAAMVHHDVAVTGDSFLVPFSEPHREYRGRRVKFDGLLRVSWDGSLLDEWLVADHLGEIQPLHVPSPLDSPPRADSEGSEQVESTYDYYHVNTVEVLAETALGRRDPRFQPGNLLLCLRNTSLLVILDRDTREVVWSWGPGALDYPHMPTLLENGHLLVFDNRVHGDRSRILELDPLTGETVWQYMSNDFYSKWRGSSQRLPNGNTLICESQSGRAFEVTPDGKTVWEFYNPEMKRGRRKRIYRMMRYGPDQLEALLSERFPAVVAAPF